MLRKISVIGLGYVGLPLAVAFGQNNRVVAFDINRDRVSELQQGIDATLEVETKALQAADLLITDDALCLASADFHIIAVPTRIDSAKRPDLGPLMGASKAVGAVLKPGDIVVYESTVYPGATEEDCVPVLERCSGLKCGVDFFVGYSPERINPGDKIHSFTNITKVVSGQNPKVLQQIAEVYESVVSAGVFRAHSIKVAEAAKVIENAQRDINIAFVNELKVIFDKMDIDIQEVLAAAKTKWNFLDFTPGLVGGHCIGVDPYYLTHKAQQLGYHPEILLAGRRINDDMGRYVAEQTVKKMIANNLHVHGSQVGILGFTFKENCPDVRNTKVIDVVNELKTYCLKPVVVDGVADEERARDRYGIRLSSLEALRDVRVIIIAVAHDVFICQEVAKILASAEICIDIKKIKQKIMNTLEVETAASL